MYNRIYCNQGGRHFFYNHEMFYNTNVLLCLLVDINQTIVGMNINYELDFYCCYVAIITDSNMFSEITYIN